MTAQDLKNSILQLAMQGKLVPQDPSDEPVDLKGLRLKNTDECEFDIPDSWRLAHLESISTVVPSKQYQILESEVKQHGKCSVISQSKAYSIGFTDNIEKVYSHKQPVVVFGDHTTEVKYLDFDFVVGADGVKIFEPVYRVITAKFLFYALQYYSIGLSKIGGYSRHYKFIKNKPIPLPPIFEQERIVSRIEQLLPLVENYGEAEERLKELNAEFPDKLRKSILQQAIQGKLTERDSADEPACELLKRIRAEKAKLISDGKIKKEKPLPPITDEEKPFDIPDTWEWVRLSDLCKSISDGDHQPPPQVSNGIPFLVISNVSSGKMDFSNTRYVSENYFESLSNDRVAENGDILFTVTGSYGIPIKVNCNEQFCFQRHIALLKLLIDWDYLFYTLKSPVVKSQCDATATGIAQKTVGLNSLRSMLIPLPPLAEQKRIVARVEELLSVCNNLAQE